MCTRINLPDRLVIIAVYAAIAIPFIVYFCLLAIYTVDIPVWDDYVNPLDITNQAILAEKLPEKLSILATPMNGHIPFLPRVLLYIEYKLGVDTTIKTALIISNMGWAITTLLLLVYCHKRYAISLPMLLPVPFFMFSITHWEAMDFYSSAFQMYWGSGLLAVAGIIALAEKKPLIASLCLLGGIFSSGGTLAAYPVCLLLVIISKQWRSGVLFSFYTAAALMLYAHVSPPAQQVHELPNAIQLALYLMEFMGSLLSNGAWDISPLAIYHTIIGAILLLLFLFFVWKVKVCLVIKMIFLYVIVLGAMAGYARMDWYSHAVSRYAMYPLLAVSCLYLLIAAWRTQTKGRAATVTISIAATIALLIWSYSLIMCRTPLQINHNERTASMQKYLATGDPATLLSWNAEHAKGVLEASIKTGLYDYRQSITTP